MQHWCWQGLNWENQLCGVDAEVSASTPEAACGRSGCDEHVVSAGQAVPVLVHEAQRQCAKPGGQRLDRELFGEKADT